MGLFRKLTSLSTGGIVDFRSDKERTALYGRQARNELRKQTELLRRREREQNRNDGSADTSVSEPPVAPRRSNVIGPDAPLEERVRSTDPAVKAAAIAEWRAINRAANS